MYFEWLDPSDSDALNGIESLRQRLLRDPIGLVFSPEELQRERLTDSYLAAYELIEGRKEIIGSLQLRKEAGREAATYRIRQVVVDQGFQGSGIGRTLMTRAHEYALEKEPQIYQERVVVILDARVHIVPFYLKLGYQVCGDPFFLVGIEHFPMKRNFID